ncbi:MAG: NAD(P)-binding domain-containing protein [Bryobacteraceae bacterium]
MKSRKTGGLIGAGGVGQSFLSRLPALLAHVGPVKGASLHVSRRIANNLRAGMGVKEYSALAKCGIVFIAVPEDSLDRICNELAAAVPLTGKLVILCDVFRDSTHAGALRSAGAKVATLNSIPELDEKVFVAEGHSAAIDELDRLLASDHRKLIHIKASAKPMYLAGIHIAAHLFLPWVAGAVEGLRAAGFSRQEATRTVGVIGWRAIRGYEKAGSKAWNAAAAEALHRFLMQNRAPLRQADRRMGILFSESMDELLHLIPRQPKKRPKSLSHAAN